MTTHKYSTKLRICGTKKQNKKRVKIREMTHSRRRELLKVVLRPDTCLLSPAHTNTHPYDDNNECNS